MENEINFKNPHIVSMLLLGVLNELQDTANRLDLTGDVKYTYNGVNVDEWDNALVYLKEVCEVNGYNINKHIIEVRKGFNVYLILE